MTRFEQEVAEALRFEILKVRELHSPEAPTAIAFALAPRAAAAIVAAYDKVELLRQEGRTAWTPAEAREYALTFALATLRGAA